MASYCYHCPHSHADSHFPSGKHPSLFSPHIFLHQRSVLFLPTSRWNSARLGSFYFPELFLILIFSTFFPAAHHETTRCDKSACALWLQACLLPSVPIFRSNVTTAGWPFYVIVHNDFLKIRIQTHTGAVLVCFPFHSVPIVQPLHFAFF